MPHNRGSDVFGLGQMLLRLRLGVAQPTDIEIVVAGLDRVPREAPEPSLFPLILALCLAERIISEGLLEFREVLDGQRAR